MPKSLRQTYKERLRGHCSFFIFGTLMAMDHPEFMYRCIELAKRGTGFVAPNPMVGSVLVYDNKVIGEGWHEKYGNAHAEVNCIQSAIRNGYSDNLQHSDLYVSLEPCSHTGKTPPCSDLIISKQIPRVFIGCRDPFPLVNGKGIEKLRTAGVEVQLCEGSLEQDCIELNAAFFTFHKKHRPYIILKWAETADGFIGSVDKRLLISNSLSNRLVHKWRSESAAILVGTNTALKDDPSLTQRLWEGPSPVRLVLDRNLKIPSTHKIYDNTAPTIVFNLHKHDVNGFHPHVTGGTWYCRIEDGARLLQSLMDQLYALQIQSVLVEGGAALHQSFIDAGLWDEARVITNKSMIADKGIAAPQLKNFKMHEVLQLENDLICSYRPIE